jgi:colanic acid/amylovoran biosynthesis glycosyltransferase
MRQDGHGPRNGHVLYVIGTFPLLTTTFIDRELATLRDDGVEVGVVSIRRPAGPLSPEQSAAMDDIRYVMPVHPLRLVAALAMALATRPIALLRESLRLVSGRHPSFRARLKTFGHIVLGVYVWGLVRKSPPAHVHAHFVDRATIVAMVVATLFRTGYSATAHANDIYVNPVLLAEKASSARFVATCTGFNARHLSTVAPAANIELVYHGLDIDRYPRSPVTENGEVRIISVAQLKEKKGLTYLISGCRDLAERGVSFECDIIGDGPLMLQLQEQIEGAGLADKVHLLGPLPHDEVIERLRASTLFVLPCVIAGDGDRDGIPNVILEAMAVGRPVISTTVSGIPEAVADGVSGRLVPPADATQLAGAMADLLESPVVRSQMGAAGRKRIEELFDVRRNARKLEQLLTS